MKFVFSLQSEWIKKRNSGAGWLIVAGGLFIPLIILAARLMDHSATVMGNSTEGIWQDLFKKCWQFMSVFFLPMSIVLAASLVAQIEYRNNAWKQIYTSPQGIHTIFWAKYTMLLIMVVQLFLLFNIGVFLVVAFPALIYSDVPYPAGDFPRAELCKSNLNVFICCLPVLALQYLLSLHIRNFFVSIAAGFAMLIASLIAINWHCGYLLPYTYCPIQFLDVKIKVDSSANIPLWAVSYFALFSSINYALFMLRVQTKISERARSLIASNKTLLVLISSGFILLVSTVCYFANKQHAQLPIDTQATINRRIKAVEKNLGAHIIPGAKGWTIYERMRHYKVKGLSIAVVYNFRIEWAKGYGLADVTENRPVTTATQFVPGSLSKSVNAMGLMKLVQDKKIGLFDDINKTLQTWQFPYDSVSKNKAISLANLLSHSAGVSVHGFYGYKPGDTLPNIVQLLNGTKPANSKPVRSIFQPGTKMEYSGGGTMITQMMLMDVTQQPYDQYMYSRILKPLGMVNSSYTQPPPADKKNLRATGYDSTGTEIPGRFPILPEQAAAGLWTTPTDMCKFILEIQRSLIGRANNILSKENTDLMLTPYKDERAALGFFIDDNKGYKYFGHEAGNAGFSGVFFGSMDGGKGVAVFINSENSDILREVVNSIIEAYNWKGFEKKQTVKTVAVADSIMKKYVGRYEAADAAGVITRIDIYRDADGYWYKTGNEKRRMYFTSDTKFVNNENPWGREFKTDAKGHVKTLTISHSGQKRWFKKIP